MSPMTTAIMGTVPATRAGMASATSNTMRQVGSVFGVAVLGNLLWRPVTDHVLLTLHALRLPAAMTGAVAAAVKAGGDAALRRCRPPSDSRCTAPSRPASPPACIAPCGSAA